MSKIISIRNDFSEYPGLRHCSISENSGEEFYHKVLNKSFYEALISDEKLVIDLDSTAGYAPSFLDEAFGRLVYDFTKNIVENKIEIVSTEEPSWIKDITNLTYSEWETRRLESSSPKITQKHDDWYKVNDDGEYVLGQWAEANTN